MKVKEINTYLLIYIMSDFIHFIKEMFHSDMQIGGNTAQFVDLEKKINNYVEQYIKKTIGDYGVALLRDEIASIL